MIYLLDEICADASAAAAVVELYEREYVSGAGLRGMQLLDRWAAPPLSLHGGTQRFYWCWGLADIGDFWSMRGAAAADPSVSAFWSDLDAHIGSRRRQVLGSVDGLLNPPPQPPARRALSELGARATGQLQFASGVTESRRRSWLVAITGLPRDDPRVVASVIAPNMAGSVGGGDYSWDLVFASRGARDSWFDERWPDALAAHCEVLEIAAWTSRCAECVELAVQSPIKRTLALGVRSTAPPEATVQFEQELSAMPEYIGAIRNWCLARVDYHYGEAGWTHLWQQEFNELGGLLGDYMTSPYHWGLVDRWFDPEMPEHVVAGDFAHVFCRYPESILCER